MFLLSVSVAGHNETIFANWEDLYLCACDKLVVTVKYVEQRKARQLLLCEFVTPLPVEVAEYCDERVRVFVFFFIQHSRK